MKKNLTTTLQLNDSIKGGVKNEKENRKKNGKKGRRRKLTKIYIQKNTLELQNDNKKHAMSEFFSLEFSRKRKNKLNTKTRL